MDSRGSSPQEPVRGACLRVPGRRSLRGSVLTLWRHCLTEHPRRLPVALVAAGLAIGLVGGGPVAVASAASGSFEGAAGSAAAPMNPSGSVSGFSLASEVLVPGVPADPTVFFEEDFDEDPPVATRVTLSDLGYTASPFWLDVNHCNGLVVALASLPQQAGDCYTPGAQDDSGGPNNYQQLLAKAQALGRLNGLTPADAQLNRALATNTAQTKSENDGEAFPIPNFGSETVFGKNQVMIQSTTPTVAIGGSLYALLSVDYAVTACTSWKPAQQQPLLQFQWLKTDDTVVWSDEVQNPCTSTDPPYTTYNISAPAVPAIGKGSRAAAATVEVRAVSLRSGSAVLLQADGLNWRILNLRNAQHGNDGALDNVRVLDATPRVDKAFSDSEVTAGESTTVRFIVTNTSDLLEKSGWEFTDTMNTDLLVSDTENAVVKNTCGATVTADANSSVIQVKNGILSEGQSSCEIEVAVTPAATSFPAAITNCASNISEWVGVRLPAECAELTETAGSYDLVKSSDPGDGAQVSPGDTITYTITATATTGDVEGLSVEDDLSRVLDNASLVPGSIVARDGSGARIPVSQDGSTIATEQRFVPVAGTVVLTYQVVVNDDAVGVSLINVATGHDAEDRPPANCSDQGSPCETVHTTPRLGVRIEKRDSGGNALDGSSWQLAPDADGSPDVGEDDPPVVEVEGQVGVFEVGELLPGTYWLTETRAPAGFELLAEPIKFTLDAQGMVTLDSAHPGSTTVSVDADGVARVSVVNVRKIVLPRAGGSSALLVTIGGLVLLTAAGGGLLSTRRRLWKA